MRVLLLNSYYEPTGIVSWTRAMVLICTGKAEVVESTKYEIHTISKTYKIPSVIRKISSSRRKRFDLPMTRNSVFFRDDFTCQYCQRVFNVNKLTLDHVVPKSKGGKHCWENLVSSCGPCNVKKADRTPDQANMPLKYKPSKPKWSCKQEFRMTRDELDKWGNYIK